MAWTTEPPTVRVEPPPASVSPSPATPPTVPAPAPAPAPAIPPYLNAHVRSGLIAPRPIAPRAQTAFATLGSLTPTPTTTNGAVPQSQSYVPPAPPYATAFIHHAHSTALRVLARLPPVPWWGVGANDVAAAKSASRQAVEASGATWPGILDQDYPLRLSSDGTGVQYSVVYHEYVSPLRTHYTR